MAILVGVGSCIYLSVSNQLNVPAFLSALPFVTGAGSLTRSVFLGGLTGILYGILVGLGGVVISSLYNFFSGLFGGVDITLQER